MEQEREAVRAARDLSARLGQAATVAAGTEAVNGWTVVAHATFGGGALRPSDLWALKEPEDGRVVVVVTDEQRATPELLSWDQLKQQVEAMRVAANAVANVESEARHADPVLRAERQASMQAFFDVLHVRSRSTRVVGNAQLHLHDDEPERVEGAVLIGGDGKVAEGITAKRVDYEKGLMRGPLTGEPLAVWARPLSNGLWRRGRLQIEEDRIVFVDEPEASGPSRGDGAARALTDPLEAALLGCPTIRAKARRSEAYADLLYRALENAYYRHVDGAEYHGGMRSTAGLVEMISDNRHGSYYMAGPDGVLDEQVLADLRTLGWLPVVSSSGQMLRYDAKEAEGPVHEGPLSAQERADLAAYDADPALAGEERPFPVVYRGRLAWRHTDGALRTGPRRDTQVIGGA